MVSIGLRFITLTNSDTFIDSIIDKMNQTIKSYDDEKIAIHQKLHSLKHNKTSHSIEHNLDIVYGITCSEDCGGICSMYPASFGKIKYCSKCYHPKIGEFINCEHRCVDVINYKCVNKCGAVIKYQNNEFYCCNGHHIPKSDKFLNKVSIKSYKHLINVIDNAIQDVKRETLDNIMEYKKMKNNYKS